MPALRVLLAFCLFLSPPAAQCCSGCTGPKQEKKAACACCKPKATAGRSCCESKDSAANSACTCPNRSPASSSNDLPPPTSPTKDVSPVFVAALLPAPAVVDLASCALDASSVVDSPHLQLSDSVHALLCVWLN